MLNPSDYLPYGPLEMEEVFFAHDGPRFFSLISPRFSMHVLGLCVDEDDDANTVTFLYLVLSRERFFQVRSGVLALRQAFELAGNTDIWRIIENYQDDSPMADVASVRFDEIPDTDLPSLDARISLQTNTTDPFTTSELLSLAEERVQSVTAIELREESELQTAFSLRGLGKIEVGVQDLLDAIAQESEGRPTARGSIPANILQDVQMSVFGLRAASFAFLLRTDESGLFENTALIADTLTRFTDLLSAAESNDAMLPALREYGPRARGKFRLLLQSLAEAGTGIGVHAAPLGQGLRSASLDSARVRGALITIDAVTPTVEEIPIPRATLTASNTSRGTFELVDMALGRRFSGRVSAEVAPEIDGLRVGSSSYVRARLIVQTDFADTSEEPASQVVTLIEIETLEIQ